MGESVGESNLTDHKRQLEESKEYAATLEGRVKDLEKQVGARNYTNIYIKDCHLKFTLALKSVDTAFISVQMFFRLNF